MIERFLIVLFSFFLAACGSGEEEKKMPAALPPQYYYYPRANVYFDSANKDYVFAAGDSSTWQTAKQIPNIVQGLMDKSVFIPNPPQPVWKDNEQHKLIYSAVLYATPEDTVAKKEPPPPPPPVKSPDTASGEEKRERKGLRKFVDKVFSVFKKDKKKKDSVQ
jgi:hypothetical protein